MAAVSFAEASPIKDVLGEVRRSGEGLLPSAQFFKQMGVSRDAIGASGAARRHATHEGADTAPPSDLAEQLRRFEQRRGAHHIQLFMEEAINEIMEGGGATRTIQQLTHMRSLLDDVLIQVQNLLQKTLKSGGGRDIKAMTRLRASFLMLSRADRGTSDQSDVSPKRKSSPHTFSEGKHGPVGSGRRDCVSSKGLTAPNVHVHGAKQHKEPASDVPVILNATSTDKTASAEDECPKIEEMQTEIVSLRRRLQNSLRKLHAAEQIVHTREQTIRTLQQDVASRDTTILNKDRQVRSMKLALSKSRNDAMAERARNPILHTKVPKDGGLAVSDETAAANAVDAKREAEWIALKREQSRRAVLLGEQERSIAKLSSRCQALELKNRMLMAKQEETAKTAAEAFDAASGQEIRNEAADRRMGRMKMKIREQETALQFVMEQLELRERDVAELRVSSQIAEEKRSRAEARLAFALQSSRYGDSGLQDIAETS